MKFAFSCPLLRLWCHRGDTQLCELSWGTHHPLLDARENWGIPRAQHLAVSSTSPWRWHSISLHLAWPHSEGSRVRRKQFWSFLKFCHSDKKLFIKRKNIPKTSSPPFFPQEESRYLTTESVPYHLYLLCIFLIFQGAQLKQSSERLWRGSSWPPLNQSSSGREVGLTLQYFTVKDVPRKVEALQPTTVVLAVEDASSLSVLSSRNDSLVFGAQVCACPYSWSGVSVQLLASHLSSLNLALWCGDIIFIPSSNQKFTDLET